MSDYELIVCIVNNGFSETVMDVARAAGAGGGTVMHARGTANKDAEKFFGISVQPEKEMVFIIVSKDVKDGVLHAIYKEVGLQTAGQGIAFSVPVRDAVGLSSRETLATVAAEIRPAEELESEAKSESAEAADGSVAETSDGK